MAAAAERVGLSARRLARLDEGDLRGALGDGRSVQYLKISGQLLPVDTVAILTQCLRRPLKGLDFSHSRIEVEVPPDVSPDQPGRHDNPQICVQNIERVIALLEQLDLSEMESLDFTGFPTDFENQFSPSLRPDEEQRGRLHAAIAKCVKLQFLVLPRGCFQFQEIFKSLPSTLTRLGGWNGNRQAPIFVDNETAPQIMAKFDRSAVQQCKVQFVNPVSTETVDRFVQFIPWASAKHISVVDGPLRTKEGYVVIECPLLTTAENFSYILEELLKNQGLEILRLILLDKEGNAAMTFEQIMMLFKVLSYMKNLCYVEINHDTRFAPEIIGIINKPLIFISAQIGTFKLASGKPVNKHILTFADAKGIELVNSYDDHSPTWGSVDVF